MCREGRDFKGLPMDVDRQGPSPDGPSRPVAMGTSGATTDAVPDWPPNACCKLCMIVAAHPVEQTK